MFKLIYLKFAEKLHSWSGKVLGYEPYNKMQGDLSYLRALLAEVNLKPPGYVCKKQDIESAVEETLEKILPEFVTYKVHVLNKEPGNIDVFVVRSTSKEN